MDPINSDNYNLLRGYGLAKNVGRDFLELSASSYEYCYDNPVRFTDPNGEQVSPNSMSNMQNMFNADAKRINPSISTYVDPVKALVQPTGINDNEASVYTGHVQPRTLPNSSDNTRNIQGDTNSYVSNLLISRIHKNLVPDISPLEAAYLADHVYGDKSGHTINGWKVSNLNIPNVVLRDDKKGFNSQLYERVMENGDTQYAYVTQGTDLFSRVDWNENLGQINGATPQYSLSVKNARAINNYLQGKELVFIGHSLGGGLASTNALATGRDAVTFNAVGLSARTKLGLGLPHNIGQIDAWVLAGELVETVQGKVNLKAEGIPRPILVSYATDIPFAPHDNVARTVQRGYYHTMSAMIKYLKKNGYE